MTKQDDLQMQLAGTNFFQLAKREAIPRVRVRLLVLGNLQAGKSKTEVANSFNISFPSIRQWIHRFTREGIEGLRDKAGKGRKAKLPTDKQEEFRKQVELLQEERKGGRVRAQDIQVMLREKFQVDHALASVYHVLERSGFSWISARSKHPKSDEVAQEGFKKNLRRK